MDASEAAQIVTIDKTFSDLTDQKLEDIRHPDAKKKHLRVVDSYDILPDDETWANSYIMIRFPERPSAATAAYPSAGASSRRLANAVLRPIKDDDQQIMEYFLPPEQDLDRLEDSFLRPAADKVVQQIRDLSAEDGSNPQIDEIFTSVHYDHIRSYEVFSTQTAPAKEVLVSFGEDDMEKDYNADEVFNEPLSKKRKGVYYKELHIKTLLRKTRAKRRGVVERRGDLWDKTRIGYRLPQGGELLNREEAKESITDPNWINEELRKMRGGENAANGLGEAIDDEEIGLDEEAERAAEDVDEDD